MDDLLGPAAVASADRRPQRRVTRHRLVPSRFERVEIHVTVERAKELLDVEAGFWLRQRVEPHPFLHRREWVGVFDFRVIQDRRGRGAFRWSGLGR